MPAAGNHFSKDDRVRIGDWTLDPAASRLERQGEQIHLEPRLTDLLHHFARNPLRVIPKEELIESVWQGRTLDNAAIARAVAELRKALGDTPNAPSYIETIPKRGYRLVARVDEEKERSWNRALVAVFAAVTLGLVLLLSSGWLASRNQSGVTDSPAAAEGTSSEQALHAFRLASTALESGGQADNETAVVHLTRALELDPEFALARAGLAEAYSIRATWYGTDADWNDAALVEASRAVSLAPELPESHRALGFALATNERFGDAELAYRRALDLRPDDETIAFRLGEVLGYRGQWQEALTLFAAIGPTYRARSSLYCEIGTLLLGLGYRSEGLAAFEVALETTPFGMCANIRWALSDISAGDLEAARLRTELLAGAHADCCDQLLGEIAYRRGRLADAVSHLERALERAVQPKSTAMRIRLAQIAGDTDSLRAIGASLERQLTAGVDIYFSASLLTIISAELGDTKDALHWHDEATARGHLDWRSDLAEPTFESLRETPEFAAAISRMRARIEEMRDEIESSGLLEELRSRTRRPGPTAP